MSFTIALRAIIRPSEQLTFSNWSCLQASSQLRPISAEDFREAAKEVVPSVQSDSASMEELKQWNAQYGDAKDRSRWNPKLSYFS